MLLGYKLAIFVVLSVGFGWLTRNSLRSLRSHGLYRLLAVTSTIALILMQIDHWFADPLSPHQFVAYGLLTIGTVLMIRGAIALHRRGKPDPTRQDDSLIGIERTTALVTTGIYRHIRHPIYSALLFIIWGAFLKRPQLIPFILTLAATVFVTATAKTEETENIAYFGDRYRDYMRRSKMFIPFLF